MLSNVNCHIKMIISLEASEDSQNFKTRKMDEDKEISSSSKKVPKTQLEDKTKFVFKDFCDIISLDGYNHLYIADAIINKLFWSFVIIGMTGLGVYFLAENTDAYFKSRLVTNIETTTANLSVSVHTVMENEYGPHTK